MYLCGGTHCRRGPYVSHPGRRNQLGCVRSNGSQNRHVLVLSSFRMKPDSSHTSLPIPQQLNIEIINILEIAVL